jgi:hypothetical protein
MCVAKLNKARAFGMFRDIGFKADLAQRVGGAA